jgi:nucleoside diphosphate kinase
MAENEIVVHVTVPPDVGADLRVRQLDGVELQPAVGGHEQTTRFGIAEAILITTFCAGVLKVVKLAVEIRNLLKQKQPQSAAPGRARIASADRALQLDITPEDSDSELERKVTTALETGKATRS